MPTLRIANFAGGLNLRDSPLELALNETPDALNWTLGERGTTKLRPGFASVAALPGLSGKPAYIFYSEALNLWLCARETSGAPNTFRLYTHGADLTTGAWTDRGAINSVVTAKAAFVDFPGTTPKVVIATDVNSGATKGIWTWDGTTLTNVSTTVAGSAIALWQNKVWVLGYPTSDANGTPPDLFACAAGDPTTWATGSGGLRVGLRDKDAAPGIALGIAGGALIAFKQRSAYRINDSTTGQPSTIDSSSGSYSSASIAGYHGRLYTWGLDGLYEWDGIGRGRNVGGKLRPLVAVTVPGSSSASAGGVLGNNVIFADIALGSYDAAGNVINAYEFSFLEYNPEHGWIMNHQASALAALGHASSLAVTKQGGLYFACYSAGENSIYSLTATPGSDGGALSANNFRTRWLEPYGGKLCRINRAIIEGLLVFAGTNTLKFRVYKDGDLSAYDEYDVTSDLRASSATDTIQPAPIRSLGHARSFAFEVVAGTAPGDAAVFALELEWIPLER